METKWLILKNLKTWCFLLFNLEFFRNFYLIYDFLLFLVANLGMLRKGLNKSALFLLILWLGKDKLASLILSLSLEAFGLWLWLIRLWLCILRILRLWLMCMGLIYKLLIELRCEADDNYFGITLMDFLKEKELLCWLNNFDQSLLIFLACKSLWLRGNLLKVIIIEGFGSIIVLNIITLLQSDMFLSYFI